MQVRNPWPWLTGPSGCRPSKLRQQRQRVTRTRVVLHRARAQRVELRIDRESSFATTACNDARFAAQRPPAGAVCHVRRNCFGIDADAIVNGGLCEGAAAATRFLKNQLTHLSQFPMRGKPRHNRAPRDVFYVFAVHDRVVLIEYDDSTREHARERSIHDLNAVVLSEACMTNCRQAFDVLQVVLLLKTLVREWQIIRHHAAMVRSSDCCRSYRT